MKWQLAKEAFEKNFVIPELTNIYQVLALTVRNIKKYTSNHQSNVTNTNVSTILKLSNSASYGKVVTFTLPKSAELQYALSILYVNCAL
jgi:hypothetical protein